MGFLDGIEKLINEHGSAIILKERIGLANDKYAALEDKAKGLQASLDRLEAENARLTDENNRLRKEAAAREAAPAPAMDELRERVLLAVAERDNRYTRDVASALGISPNVAEFNLEELKEARLLHVAYSMASYAGGGGAHWSISHEGRRYLLGRGLLK